MNAAEWFVRNRIGVFPIKPRSKEPACSSWDDYICTPAEAIRLTTYGVILGLLAVADSDSPETEAWNASHLPDTPFKVTTGPYHNGAPGRGRHRWYRRVYDAPHFIHRDGHTIEFRHRGQYVVGAGSRHPSGVIYTADAWSWNILDIPIFPANFLFSDGSCGRFSAPGEPYEFPGVVRAGERHDQLFRLLRSCKGSGLDLVTTRELVHRANANRCIPPLPEDRKFEQWFRRQWNKPDRPFTPTRAPEIPDRPLEPNAPTGEWDLDSPGGSL